MITTRRKGRQITVEVNDHGTVKVKAVCMHAVAARVAAALPWQSRAMRPSTDQVDPDRPWDKTFAGRGRVWVRSINSKGDDLLDDPNGDRFSVCIKIEGRRLGGRGWADALAGRIVEAAFRADGRKG